jgi:hypothetical protein
MKSSWYSGKRFLKKGAIGSIVDMLKQYREYSHWMAKFPCYLDPASSSECDEEKSETKATGVCVDSQGSMGQSLTSEKCKQPVNRIPDYEKIPDYPTIPL